MKTQTQLDRLQKMILNDNLRIPNGFLEILKSELTGTLEGYFKLVADSVEFSLSADEEGYSFVLSGRASDVRKARTIR